MFGNDPEAGRIAVSQEFILIYERPPAENLFVRRLIIPGESTSIPLYQNFNNFVPFFPRREGRFLRPGDAKLIGSRGKRRP